MRNGGKFPPRGVLDFLPPNFPALTLFWLAPLVCFFAAGGLAKGSTNLILTPPNNSTNLVFTNAIDLGGTNLTVTVPTNTATMTGRLSNSSGTAGLTKSGGGTLALSASNSYNGITIISQGLLRVGNSNALGLTTGGTTVENGATLDLNARSLGGETVTVSGAGMGGKGALVNLGSNSASGFRLALSADASVGGTARFDTSFGGTVISGGTNTLTKVGTNQFIINIGTTSLGTLRVEEGSVVAVNSSTPFGDANAATLVASNASLQFFNNTSSALTNSENIVLAGGAELASTFATNPQTLRGNLILGGGTATVRVDPRGAGTLFFAGQVAGIGSLNKTGAGTLVLRGTNTQTGQLIVGEGSLTLAENAVMRFAIGAPGLDNFLRGTGTVHNDGRFEFDLSGASNRTGDTWTIVAPGLTNSYGPNFLVSGFSGSGGLWTNTTNNATYVFAQSNGVLTVQSAVTDHYAEWVGDWQEVDPSFTDTAGSADPDADTFNNTVELAFAGNPVGGDGTLLTARSTGAETVFSYVARKSPPGGVDYVVQATTNLVNGPWTNAAVTITNADNQAGLPAPADYERKEFAVAATNREFFRVQAVMAPGPAPRTEGNLDALPNLIAEAVAAGLKQIVIPPGRYRVGPVQQQHLRLRGLKDTVIIADGVEMLCTQTTRALTIDDCENLTIRGLTIDYDPLPYTQGRITAISADKSRLEVEIFEGYPEPVATIGSVEIFDPATDSLRGRLTYYSTRCEPDGPARAVLIKSSTGGDFATEQVGDIAVIKTSFAPGGSIPHAVYATRSKGLVLEDITLYASNSFGFLENGCEGSRYRNCRIDRRAPGEDSRLRSHRRLRSMNADAFHSKNARSGPTYDKCSAFFMGDDAIAVNGDFHYITRVEGSTLRVLAKSTMTLQVNDKVQLFTEDGRRPDDRRVTSIAADGPITAEERAMLLGKNLNEDLRKDAMDSAFLVTLDAASDVEPGTLICSAAAIGNGLAIRNCHIGQNRSRGIIVKAGRGEITNNHIEGSRMTGISVTPEYWWMEAGLAEDLIIAGNRITDGGGMGIAVVATGGDGSIAPAGAFKNITLRDNLVAGGAQPGLLLTSIRGLVEENNSIQPDPGKELYPWEIGAWGEDGLADKMLNNVEVEAAP